MKTSNSALVQFNPTCSPPLAGDVEELHAQPLRPVNSLLKDVRKIKSKTKE